MGAIFERFPDPAHLARALATAVAHDLNVAIAAREAAGLALSGGRTPARFLKALSREDIPWPKLTVTLVDERWVPPSSRRSNANLLMEHLLQGPAGAANFVPLFRPDRQPRDAAAVLNAALGQHLEAGFDVVVLGLGADGHTASFFPDALQFADALDADAPPGYLAIDAESAGEPRLTLNLAALLRAGALYLHVEGSVKNAVLDRALLAGPHRELPVRAVLHQRKVQVRIFSCPQSETGST